MEAGSTPGSVEESLEGGRLKKAEKGKNGLPASQGQNRGFKQEA